MLSFYVGDGNWNFKFFVDLKRRRLHLRLKWRISSMISQVTLFTEILPPNIDTDFNIVWLKQIQHSRNCSLGKLTNREHRWQNLKAKNKSNQAPKPTKLLHYVVIGRRRKKKWVKNFSDITNNVNILFIQHDVSVVSVYLPSIWY